MATKTLTEQETENNVVEPEQIAHLAGAFDMAGNITLRVTKSSDFSLGFTMRPTVYMTYPVRESEALMGKVDAYCEDQGVAATINQTNKEGESSYRLTIEGKENNYIERFLKPLMPYLITKYRPAILMLDEVLPRIEDGQHKNKEGFVELMGYADELRKGRTNRGRLKYTQEWFEEEWSLAK